MILDQFSQQLGKHLAQQQPVMLQKILSAKHSNTCRQHSVNTIIHFHNNIPRGFSQLTADVLQHQGHYVGEQELNTSCTLHLACSSSQQQYISELNIAKIYQQSDVLGYSASLLHPNPSVGTISQAVCPISEYLCHDIHHLHINHHQALMV